MIRVSVMYKNKENAFFDHAYYANQHMPLVVKKLTPFGLIRAEVEKGISGGPNQPAPYLAVGHLLFDSVDQYEKGFAAERRELGADIPHYTDLVPLIQISEIVS